VQWNPVLDDLLHLMVYCHRPETRGRLPTPPLRGHNYLRENGIANWASAAVPGNSIPATRTDARTSPGPSNSRGDPGPSMAGGEQEQRDDSLLLLHGLSSSLSYVSDAEEGYEASIRASLSPIADLRKT